MNVIKTLEQEINNNSWDTDTKARHLYLRSCELFTFDPRIYYASIPLKKEILNRHINLENVTDFRVVCSSWSREVFIPLLELISRKGILIEDQNHYCVKFSTENSSYCADACLNSDITRVKMKNSTENFTQDNNFYYQDHELFAIDQQINYIKDYYSSIKISYIVNTIQSEYQRIHNIKDITSIDPDKLFLYKLFKIQELISDWPLLTEYYDLYFAINYLFHKFFNDFERLRIKEEELFDSTTNDWNFKKIYTIHLNFGDIYYILSYKDGKYRFYPSDSEEVQNIIASYPSYQKEAKKRLSYH